MYQYFIPFQNCFIFCCIDVPHFVYPSVSWWAFGLFPFFDCYELLEKFIYKFWGKHIFSFLLGVYPGVGSLSHTVASCLLFWGIAKLISKWLYHFTFFPAMYKGSNLSTSSSILVSWCLILGNSVRRPVWLDQSKQERQEQEEGQGSLTMKGV